MRKPPNTKRPGATGRRRQAKTQERRAPHPGRSGPTILALAVILAVTVAAYLGALDNDFVRWDDPVYVQENIHVLQKHYGALAKAVVASNFHPLTMFSLAMNASEPPSARPFIATNIFLHTVNTGLVFWLVFLLSRRRLLAASFAALVFGIHPMHVESVAWVSERKDVLYVMLFLLGTITYWRYLEKRARPLLAATYALFLLSCLAKGMAVVFPLVMMLLDYWKRQPLLQQKALLEKAPFFATSLLFGLIAVNVQSGGDFHGLLVPGADQLRALPETTPFNTLQRVTFPTYGNMMYVWKLIAPVHLSPFYPYPATSVEASHPKYLLSLLFFLGTIALVIWDLRRTRVITFGVGWYLVTIMPVLQWVPVGSAIMADRYTYLSYVGLLFALGMGLASLVEKRRAAAVPVWIGCGLFAAFLFVQTVREIEIWKDTETFWGTVIRQYPNLEQGYAARGNYRGRSGRVAEAMSDLQTALRLNPRKAEIYEDLGNAYGSLGKADSAIIMFDRAVSIDPNAGRTRYNRAIAYLRVGRPREALIDLAKAEEIMPLQAPTFHFPRGNAYLQLGQYQDAVAEFSRAIEAGAGDTNTYTNRGLCRLALGDAAGAAADFREALRLDPGNAEARTRLQALERVP
jgi:Flp pilus assembly protein TadD